MDQIFLYQRIAEEIRQDILAGRLHPGDRLSPIRDLTYQWKCTPGTVQRAYQELAQQGLIVSQVGKGTHVSTQLPLDRFQARASLRFAGLVNRSESFLLESLTAGYTLDEVQQALDMAKDHWRSFKNEPVPQDHKVIRFSGSHDIAVIRLSERMEEILPGFSLELNFTGSLGGLMALAEGKVDLAGCHLWDVDSKTYNEPFLRKIFPGQQLLLMRLANRNIGFIVSPGNPKRLHRLEDLNKPSVRFVNRQSGSGTRVWLDVNLHTRGIDPSQIVGYAQEMMTHSEIARSVVEGKADVGVGLQSAATIFKLDFVPLAQENYDLVTYEAVAEKAPISTLLQWIRSHKIGPLDGYDFTHTGEYKILIL